MKKEITKSPSLVIQIVWDKTGQLAWIAGFISLSALSLGPVFGWLSVVTFLGVWLAYSVATPFIILQQLLSAGFIWVFPAAIFFSFAWSDFPEVSLRYGAQYVLTVAGAILMARRMQPRQMVSMLMASMLMVSLLSILFGRYAVDEMTGNTVFIGLFASKNHLAFFATLLFLAAVAVAVDRGQPALMRLLSIPSLIVVPPLLVLTQSGTSRVTAVLAVAVFFAAMAFLRLRPVERAFAALLALVPLVPPLIFLLFGSGAELAQRFIEDVLGKDLTLTGRTELWKIAASLIERRPWLGVGFSAFWLQETVEAEGIWRAFYVPGRMGFHFHNTYYETGVELGYIGVFLLLCLLLSIMWRLIKWSSYEAIPSTLFFLVLFVVMIVRSMVEVDMLGTFQVGTILIFATAIYAQEFSISLYARGKPIRLKSVQPPLTQAKKSEA